MSVACILNIHFILFLLLWQISSIYLLLKGIFPDTLKIAKIIPIFKAGDPSFFVNYRPISLLSNFSKFFEKVIYNRLVEFAEKYDILYRCQFGFWKKSLDIARANSFGKKLHLQSTNTKQRWVFS